jgi:hypothetical protein
MKIDLGEAVVPAIGLVFGVSFFLQTRDAPTDAMQWPYLTAAAVLLLWLPILIKFVLKKETSSGKLSFSWIWRDGRRAVFIFCASVVYLILMPHLGFSLSNFFLLLIVFRGLGGQSWIRNVSVAMGIALFLHLALVVFMQLSIPQLTIGGISI